MPTGTKHTKETFLAALFAKYPEHEKLYCYKDSIFINVHTKWSVVCKTCEHIFSQAPKSHLEGKGCRKCSSKETGKKINNNAKIISDPETGFYINTKIWNKYQRSAKDRKLSFEITLEDILETYKKQNGLCAFTHAKLICDSTYSAKNNWSIDRLDSNKGYTKDNIVLVTKTINIFRNKSTASEFLEMCNMVASIYNLTQKYYAMTPQEKAERLKTHSICSKNKDKKQETSIESTSSDAIV